MTWEATVWWLEEVAKLVPVLTAPLALAAFFLAWHTLSVNRRIAQARAAIDFAIKMNADKTVLELRRDLPARASQAAAELAAVDEGRVMEKVGPPQAEDLRRASVHLHEIVDAINLFETMAVGINTRALDEDVCYRSLYTDLFEVFEGTEAFRARLEEHSSGEQYGVEMKQLYANWKNRRAREMIATLSRKTVVAS
jgi:hypothetical protein